MPQTLNKRTSIGREEFLAAIPGSMGQLEPIEKLLNCTRSALRNALEKYPDIKSELADELEREKDKIIIEMIKDAKDGDPKDRSKARETLLKAIARDRGFGERLEVTGAEGKPIVFLHTAAKMLSVDNWSRRAESFSDEREKAVDIQMKELGLLENSGA